MKLHESLMAKIFPQKNNERHLPVKKHGGIDRWLLFAVGALTVFGILMVYDSSVIIAMRDFSNPYYFVVEQLKWLAVGVGALIFFSRVDYHRWHDLAIIILVATIATLLVVFLPGLGVKALGAHRWIRLGFLVLQPAELAKLTLILYLSAWFSSPEKKRFFAFLLLVGMVVGLVIIEPDLGTAIILLAIAFMLYFFSGAPIRHFLVLLPVFVGGVIVLAVVSPYRMQRILTYLHPERDPLGASYQIRQALLALGSGGVTGVGIGQSRQKYEYLPEANTDAIFAIIGEETGFVGSTLVIGLFLFLIWRGLRVAKWAPDRFGKLLAIGIAGWIAVQAGINISAIVALLPLTGVPLPFISYGGSSLIIILSAIGILLNISKQSHI